MRTLLPILFLISILFQPAMTYAERPTVGIAMSGGGSKGVYHIGVLKALEQKGIPIDYVAGTSMGAIVAALYATGYTPEQMRELALSGDLERWAMGRLDHNYGYYSEYESLMRKEEPIISFRIDPRGKSAKSASGLDPMATKREKRLPQSLIPSLQIDMALSELFTSASTLCEGDFTKLMVPFLCVASDATAAKEYVFTHGDLGKAVRASMALPIAYSPVINEEGHLLFDGGLYDNLPWKPLQEHMNPDLLIASSCDVEYDGKRSSLSLTDQIFMLTMNERDYNLPDNGVMIDRMVDGGMLDFTRTDEIIAMGYEDTMAKIDKMVEVAGIEDRLPLGYYDDRREQFNARTEEVLINSVDIEGVTPSQRDYIMRLLNKKERKEINRGNDLSISFEQLRAKLYPSLVNGEFATSYPTLTRDSSGSYNLTMEMTSRPQIEISIGGNVSSTPFNQIYIGVEYTAIGRILRTLFGELYLGPLYNSGRVGYRVDMLMFNAPVFLDLYYDFAAKNLNHGSFGSLTTVDNTIDCKSYDNYFSLGIGAPISRRSQFTMRGNIGRSSDRSDESVVYDSDADKPWTRYEKGCLKYIALRLALDHNRLNNITNPTRGEIFSGSVIGVFGLETSYEKSMNSASGNIDSQSLNSHDKSANWIGAKVNFAKYFELDKNDIFSFGVDAEGVITTISTLSSVQTRRLSLPYYAPTAHSNMMYMPSFAAERYVAAGAMCELKLWRDLSLRSQFNVMISDKYTEDQVIIKGEGYRLSTLAEVAFMYKTPITTVKLSMNKYDLDNWNNLYLVLNIGRSIFSPRGIFY